MKNNYLYDLAESTAHTVSAAVEISAAIVIGFALLLALKNYFSLNVFEFRQY